MPCDGKVLDISFLACRPEVLGLHFAFARRSGDLYRLFSDIYIDRFVNSLGPETMATYQTSHQPSFKAGDYLAVFYDRQVAFQGLASIRSKMNPSGSSRTWLMTAEDVKAGLGSFFLFI